MRKWHVTDDYTNSSQNLKICIDLWEDTALWNIFTCIDLCDDHQNQDTEQSYHHKPTLAWYLFVSTTPSHTYTHTQSVPW